MRRLLIHLLILVMLTPGLACGPFMGVGKAQAAQASMSGMPDCKGMAMESQQKSGDGGHVFFKDCSKTDLFNTGHASLEKPDFGSKVFLVAWAAITPQYNYTPAGTNAIRGPPPDWPVFSQTQPSILLTTQRLRI